MNVTQYSNTLAAMNPKVEWPSICADEIYNFHSSKRIHGAPMLVGENLHKHLDDYSKGRNIPRTYYDVCASIVDVLAELGMKDAECEEPVEGLGLRGRIDMHGRDSKEQHWVIEIKTSTGDCLKAPSCKEIFQMSLYAKMLPLKRLPGIMCLRVNLRTRMIGVYRSYDCSDWTKLIGDKAA